MATAELTLINKLGLHARAAAKFVQVTGAHASSVRVRFGKRDVDGKSIMAIMMLSARLGSTLTISAEGEDADALIAALTQLINARFGEDE